MQLVDRIVKKAEQAVQQLAADPSIGQYVDATLPVPKPFLRSEDIRLVVIGQDPTVRRAESRASITTVLNLDRGGSLRAYLDRLCTDLGLNLNEHVYATNACKGFFTEPPTAIDTCDVLTESANVWLPLLREELAHFPEAVVLSLGQPVLAMLVRPGQPTEMKHYWGYHRDWKREGTFQKMRLIQAEDSTVGRTIFSFVHEPTMRGARAEFYRQRRDQYIQFIRRESGL